MQYLRQSTASQSVLIGPFVDSTDGVTAETALTIANTDIRLSANGGNMFAKTSGGGTHDQAGWYTITLDATDTATVGRLQLSVAVAGALPVFAEYQVLTGAVYDALFGASAPGYLQPTTAGRTLDVTATGAAGIDWSNVENQNASVDLSATAINLCDTVTTNTDMRGTDNAALATALATAQTDLDTITGTNGVTLATSQPNYTPATAAALSSVSATLGATFSSVTDILIDTNELQTDWFNGGRLDLILDAILEDTGTTLPATLATLATSAALATVDSNVDAILVDTGTTLPSQITALNNLSAAAVNAEVDTAISDYFGTAGSSLTGVPWNAAWDAEVQSEVKDALDATVDDTVPADGTRPSVSAGIYMLCQYLFDTSISGTTMTVRKPDGSTTLFTIAIDDGTTPTSKTRAS